MKSFWVLLFATFAVSAHCQDFDLSDAFDDVPAPTKKPEKPKSGDGGLPPVNDPKKPAGDPKTQKPNVVHPKESGTGGGSFGDSDLLDIGNAGDYKPDPGKGGARAADPAYGGGGGAGGDEPQDLKLLWAQFLKQLSNNIPECFHDWITNLKPVVMPLLERVLELLDVTQ